MADEPLDTPNVAESPEEATAEAERPVGPYQRTDEELVRQIRLWLTEGFEASSKRRKARAAEWAALANHQWDEDDAKKMRDQGRAVLTLNLLQTTLAAVEGEERTNRQEIKFYGSEQGDDGTAFAMNRLLKWIMDQCGGEFSLSRQFKCGIAVGEGWVVPEVDYFDDPEGTIKLVWVDEDEIIDDPLSVDPVSRDSRYLHRHQMKFEDEMEARWQGSIEKLRTACEAHGIDAETDGKGFPDIYLTPDKPGSSPKIYSRATKQWMVVETHWSQIEAGYVIVDDRGELEELKPDEFEVRKNQRRDEQRQFLMDAAAGRLMTPLPTPENPMPQPPQMPPPIQAKQRPIRCFYQAFTCGDVLLEKRASPVKQLRRFPYVPFRALYDKKERNWFGLLLLLLDMQRQHNVEQSALVQLVQLMPKQSWMGPKGSFHNKAEWEQKIAQPGKMLEYNAARGKPEPIQAPAIPRHLVDMAMSRPGAMREISGVNVEMTGARQGSDAGVVMEMRKKAASTVLSPLFDNFRQSKLETGKVLLAYIQAYIPVNRRVRVLGQEGSGYVQMTEDMQIGKFDLKVEETNASINDRIATLTVMQTTLPQIIKAGGAIPPEFVDLLPMPPHIRDAMKRQVAWDLTVAGRMPPPGWQPGMPVPGPQLPAPPGAPPQGAAPQGPPPAQ